MQFAKYGYIILKWIQTALLVLGISEQFVFTEEIMLLVQRNYFLSVTYVQ
jgi:hypothetical protein